MGLDSDSQRPWNFVLGVPHSFPNLSRAVGSQSRDRAEEVRAAPALSCQQLRSHLGAKALVSCCFRKVGGPCPQLTGEAGSCRPSPSLLGIVMPVKA